MLGAFEMHEPATIEAASRLLTTHGADAAIYAGGTELLVLMKERLVHYPHLVNIKTIPGLDGITLDPGARSLRIGPLATHRVIERSPLVRQYAPVLAELEANVANVRVRAAGTIGGNLCFAEPHSDPAALLVACGAILTLTSATGSRQVPADAFFVGLLETTRRHDEILTDILIPLPSSRTGIAYERFKTHERPSAAVAAVVTLEAGTVADLRLVVGSVGIRPLRPISAETLLRYQRPAPDLIAAVANHARDEVEPTEDTFESTDYKRHLAGILTARALTAAIERASTATSGANHAG